MNASPAVSEPRRAMHMLYFVREAFPTFRPDVEVLFGQELLNRGHAIDLVMQAEREDERVGPRPWHGQTVFVGPTDRKDGAAHRLRKHCLSVLHDFRSLRRATRAHYEAVQVRDKFLIAAACAL